MSPRSPLLRVRRQPYRDPYEGLPTDELAEPILPRWFVLLALATVPVAAVVFALAFFGLGRGETPLAERRPPPGEGMTSDVGDLVVGEREPTAHDPECDAAAGYQVAGTEADRAQLAAGLDALCDVPTRERAFAAALGEHEPVVRFAAFEATGVDVTSDGTTVYVNARYSQLPSDLLAPLIVYQAVLTEGDPAEAETVLAARRAELAVCESVVEQPGRACEDAEELLSLPDPEAALQESGFQ